VIFKKSVQADSVLLLRGPNDVAEERLILWSQKFAVDCVHHKYGPNFIDSTDPPEKNDSASLQTMTWVSLDEAPVIARSYANTWAATKLATFQEPTERQILHLAAE
jgi:hypothetical protein